jgi:anaerobic selenocysteine-containing dehydrogenase
MVVQDAFLTDTAKLADVVLPVAVHAEQEGTYLSSGGQLGLVNQALSPNGVRPDWQIICDLAGRMGFKILRNPARFFRNWRADALLGRSGPQLALPCPRWRPDAGEFQPFDLDISLPGRRPLALIIGKSLQHSGSFTTHAPAPPSW